MLQFRVEPKGNALFPDTPFFYDHIWSHVELFSPCLALQFMMPYVGEMYRKASNG